MNGTRRNQTPVLGKEMSYRLVRQLWGPAVIPVFETLLKRTDSVGGGTDAWPDGCAMLLAATIPTNKMRSHAYDILKGHAEKSPDGLDSIVKEGLFLDPGFLIAVKMLPRAAIPSRFINVRTKRRRLLRRRRRSMRSGCSCAKRLRVPSSLV